jgi:protein TonB
MSRSFTLPVVIACSAHALLMFGFTKPEPPPPDAIVPGKAPEKKEGKKIIDVSVVEPSVVTVTTEEPKSAAKPGLPPPPSLEPHAERGAWDDVIVDRVEFTRVKAVTSIAAVYSNSPRFFDGDGPGFDTAAIVNSGLLDKTPRTRVQSPPAYPFHLKAGGIEGEVVVEFVVDEHGRVTTPRVVRSTHPDFETPTLAAVAKWRFEPGTRKMAPVRFRMVVPVKFHVSD